MKSISNLLRDIRACTICSAHLPLGPRPVLQMSASAKILIVGQAPGRKVHDTGVPFNDASGDRLRDWTGLSREQFYDAKKIALLPMGFCYPGTGKSGDLPPRPECAAAWRRQLLAHLKNVQMTLVIGQYALAYHLPDARGTLTQTVAAWREHFPAVLPMPHPSPRNNMWLRKNPWFEERVIPSLRAQVSHILQNA
jgi:uracil-DNA glycosylase